MRIARPHKFTLDVDGGDISSSELRLAYLDGYSIAATWEASATRSGTLVLEASNDAYWRIPNPDQSPGEYQEIINGTTNPDATWVTISGSTKTVGAGADTHLWNVSDVNYAAVRVKFTGTGGSGDDVLTFIYVGKESG